MVIKVWSEAYEVAKDLKAHKSMVQLQQAGAVQVSSNSRVVKASTADFSTHPHWSHNTTESSQVAHAYTSYQQLFTPPFVEGWMFQTEATNRKANACLYSHLSLLLQMLETNFPTQQRTNPKSRALLQAIGHSLKLEYPTASSTLLDIHQSVTSPQKQWTDVVETQVGTFRSLSVFITWVFSFGLCQETYFNTE